MNALRDKIDNLLDELQADNEKEGVDWNGYRVIEPIYNKRMIIGYPYIILIKDNEARISTEKESIAYLDYKSTRAAYEPIYNN